MTKAMAGDKAAAKIVANELAARRKMGPMPLSPSPLSSPTGARPLPSRPSVRPRSEEHTSELQSLMRKSYAVFCLKKTNNQLTTSKISYIRQNRNIHVDL